MIQDLFEGVENLYKPYIEQIADSAYIYRFYARNNAWELLQAIHNTARQSPFRYPIMPSGGKMSVANTTCGEVGWISTPNGYRYSRVDPLTARPWPRIPDFLFDLAQQVTQELGFVNFCPNSCLINKYIETAKMGMHQDKDEGNYHHPVVSISLGLTANFAFGGLTRNGAYKNYLLEHGDIVVWGGPSRLCYHGITSVKRGIPPAPLEEPVRYNITLRQVKI